MTVTYHPKGHPGSFDRRIFVYTQLSDKMPTAILHLTGTVIASERTDGDYPYAMGALRLKQQSVRLAPERLQNERIECLNTGGKAMRPRCDEHLLPPGITFRCEPATLAPGAKGDLVIGFDPAQATRRPPGAAAPDPRRARCSAERAHAANPVRRNRVRNRQKRVI